MCFWDQPLSFLGPAPGSGQSWVGEYILNELFASRPGPAQATDLSVLCSLQTHQNPLALPVRKVVYPQGP